MQVNGLIMPIRAELRSPHFVHALVLGRAEGHGCSKPDVKIALILENFYQAFGVELGAIALQRCDQHSGVHITFERHVVWRYPGKNLPSADLYSRTNDEWPSTAGTTWVTMIPVAYLGPSNISSSANAVLPTNETLV